MTARFSPLTLRILGVNIVALLILVAGVLYLDRYQENLIRADMNALQVHATLLAGVLAETALEDGDGEMIDINVDTARLLVRRIVASSPVRARLYGGGGQLVTDSTLIGRGSMSIQVLPLPEPPPHWTRLAAQAARLYDWLFNTLPRRDSMPPFREGLEPFLAIFPEAVSAFQGSPSRGVYVRPDGHLELSVAVPVQRFRRIAGVLILSRPSVEVDSAVRALRVDIAVATVLALGTTTLLSLYLASAIARPIRKLARSADRIRHGDRAARIPDWSRRGDEIGELSVAFRAMTEALAARVAAIEAFAADVAHELKNPLTSIRSALETLPRLKDDTRRAALLAIVHADIRRIDRLISDIAAASRLDAELARGEDGQVDLARLAQALEEVHRASHAANGPALQLDVEPGVVVHGQEDRMVQVLRNLIGNAVSFSPPDGVVRLTIRSRGARAEVLVEDEGPGIPPGKEEAIFQRFYSERPAGEAFGQHSGLGLSISRQIVEAHQGTITASNRLDADGTICGARFRVDLPRVVS